MSEYKTVESVKYVSNLYHATKIAFANEVGRVLSELGVNARETFEIVCEDTTLNISSAYLRPGFAFGGSCLPKDIQAFCAIAHDAGIAAPLLNNLLTSNSAIVDGLAQRVVDGGHRQVTLYGLSFKPGTDDTRESALGVLAQRLLTAGVDVAIVDRNVSGSLAAASRGGARHLPCGSSSIPCRGSPTALEHSTAVIVGHIAPDDLQELIESVGARQLYNLAGIEALATQCGQAYAGICW